VQVIGANRPATVPADQQAAATVFCSKSRLLRCSPARMSSRPGSTSEYDTYSSLLSSCEPHSAPAPVRRRERRTGWCRFCFLSCDVKQY
jgi:hypothetical protein